MSIRDVNVSVSRVSVSAVSKGITKLSGSKPLTNVRIAMENAINVIAGNVMKKQRRGIKNTVSVVSLT